MIVSVKSNNQGFIIYSSEKICYNCKLEIIKEKEICKNCFLTTPAQYCSINCKINHQNHHNFHSSMSLLNKPKFNLITLLKTPLTKMILKNSSQGKIGLKNLGNTCYINSAIQCLSHSIDLTKYFLEKLHINEINKNNKYGSGGAIAHGYYNLISELWNSNSKYLSPYDFRQIFINFFKQFAGFNQHDSQEMLNFMLDALHEDLNRIKSKPYQELNEKFDNESNLEASSRWWLTHIKRENSIITDLFHGQFMSLIECPKCDKISTTFDPFMFLNLPIPNPTLTIKFTLVKEDGSLRILSENIDDSFSVGDLISNLSNFISTDKKFLIPILINSSNKLPRKIPSATTSVGAIYQNKFEILVFQHSDDNFKCGNSQVDLLNKKRLLFVLPMIFENTITTYGKDFKKIKPYCYPQPFIVFNSDLIDNFRSNLLKMYRSRLKPIENNEDDEFDIRKRKSSSDFAEFSNKKDDMIFLNKETKMYFSKEKIKLLMVNNHQDKSVDSKLKCSYCSNIDCDTCPLEIIENMQFNSLFNDLSSERLCIILMEIPHSIANDSLLKIGYSLGLNEDKFEACSSKVNIKECFDSFKKKERLEEENSWYCNRCKEHQQAYKTLNIFNPPLYLIIQLKRFKIRSTNVRFSSLMNKKNNNLVDFPLKNLDISNYVINNQPNLIYDLYAVNQHYGGMEGGHYTCVVKHISGDWYKYDDDSVYRIDERSVVDESAYMLFYKRVLN